MIDPLLQLLAEPIDYRFKGFPRVQESVLLQDVGDQGWNLFTSGFEFPLLVLNQSSLMHNVSLMSAYCRERHVQLAPHGKTHMSPQIARLQLEAGAWGVTVATVGQAEIFARFGVRRILLANELVEAASVSHACSLVRAQGVDLYCLVDSVVGVERMGRFLSSHGVVLPVLLEIGMREEGRAGCRTVESALEIAAAVDASPFLRLVGVEAYEGTVKHESMSENLAAVSAFLEEMRTVVTTLAGAKAFAQTDPVIVSAGGSAYFDLVVDSFSQPWDMEATVEVVLRSGCYVTHDSGMYDRLSPFGARSSGTSRFRPALELWGTVISCPDPDLTIVNFGKRDAPYDAGLPVPQLRYRNGNMSSIDATVVKMNDQHAYLRSSEGDLEVGDHLGCGISHPCTAFDKWSLLPVVDDGYDVVDAVRTLF